MGSAFVRRLRVWLGVFPVSDGRVGLVAYCEAGRFPQVSNIKFVFDAQAPAGSRVTSVEIGGEPLDVKRRYTVATRDYMARGKGTCP